MAMLQQMGQQLMQWLEVTTQQVADEFRSVVEPELNHIYQEQAHSMLEEARRLDLTRQWNANALANIQAIITRAAQFSQQFNTGVRGLGVANMPPLATPAGAGAHVSHQQQPSNATASADQPLLTHANASASADQQVADERDTPAPLDDQSMTEAFELAQTARPIIADGTELAGSSARDDAKPQADDDGQSTSAANLDVRPGAASPVSSALPTTPPISFLPSLNILKPSALDADGDSTPTEDLMPRFSAAPALAPTTHEMASWAPAPDFIPPALSNLSTSLSQPPMQPGARSGRKRSSARSGQ